MLTLNNSDLLHVHCLKPNTPKGRVGGHAKVFPVDTDPPVHCTWCIVRSFQYHCGDPQQKFCRLIQWQVSKPFADWPMSCSQLVYKSAALRHYNLKIFSYWLHWYGYTQKVSRIENWTSIDTSLSNLKRNGKSMLCTWRVLTQCLQHWYISSKTYKKKMVSISSPGQLKLSFLGLNVCMLLNVTFCFALPLARRRPCKFMCVKVKFQIILCQGVMVLCMESSGFAHLCVNIKTWFKKKKNKNIKHWSCFYCERMVCQVFMTC